MPLQLNQTQPSENHSAPSDAGNKKFAALWPLLPPLALYGIAFAFAGSSLPNPLGLQTRAKIAASIADGDSNNIDSNWVVPASETMVVSRQAAANYSVLRGRLRFAEGQIVAAPSRGQVARVMARVGQAVKAGDPLILISRGTIDRPRSNSPLERWQNQAEDAQIAAAKQQESLEGRMSSANERLQKAQARVAAAQQRVADARALVRRLQNGEEVGSNEVHTTTPVSTPQPTPRAQNASASSEARTTALRESQRLGKSADDAEAKAKAANRAAREASGNARDKQNQLSVALAALATAKAQTSKAPANSTATDKTGEAAAPASTPDTSKETRAVAEAREEVGVANTRASQLQREAAQLQSRATTLRKNANDAARRATQSLQVFDGESSNPNPARTVKNDTARESDTVVKSGGSKVSISDAVRITRNAMEESDAAIADAERIRKEVAGYENPVEGTKRNFDSATRRLENAQQQIWNTAGASRPNISSVGAPAEGVVLWITEMAREVRGGETVAGIGRPDQLQVVIEDSSGIWKSLKPGARVLALVKSEARAMNPAVTPAAADGSTPALARQIIAAQNSPSAINGVPTLARVIAIAPPLKAGAPARIRIAVYNPPQNGSANRNGLAPRAFAPGMGVLLSIAKPGKGVMIRVPAASIRRDDNGKNVVAVLSPLPATSSDQLASACRVEWREVQVGAGDGFNNQILAGLEAGERVALRPDMIYKFTLAYGAQATVHVEQT